MTMPAFPHALRALVLVGLVLPGCSEKTAAAAQQGIVSPAEFRLIDRLTWGANETEAKRFRQMGRAAWIEAQFKQRPLALPAPVQAALDAMPVAQPMDKLATDAEALRAKAFQTQDKAARAELMAEIGRSSGEYVHGTVDRAILRYVYSPDQLREQMTWFWFNHFNVRISGRPLPTMVRDYEEETIRPRAFGKFCDLVGATLRHPAMLYYLNNNANVADKINENYARELMELHTMGIGSGYTQDDVKNLARVLTGARVDLKTWPATKPPPGGVRDGIFIFDPARHDNGAKTFLGQRIKASGSAEIDEATGILCRHPATARRISTKIAQYFVADVPPPALVDRMTAKFQSSDGDIEAVMRTMIASPEFDASLGTLYKDAQRYLISALRLSFDDRVITRPRVVAQMLATMGQPLFARFTPDGYPIDAAGWNSSGQLGTRFTMATVIGRGAGRLFSGPDDAPARVAAPAIKSSLELTGIHAELAPETRAALDKASKDSEWNALFLASPEFMRK